MPNVAIRDPAVDMEHMISVLRANNSVNSPAFPRDKIVAREKKINAKSIIVPVEKRIFLPCSILFSEYTLKKKKPVITQIINAVAPQIFMLASL